MASEVSYFLAPAKVNLTLHILSRRVDGFHEMDSITAFSEFGDELVFTMSDKFSLSVKGEFASIIDLQNNSIVKAVRWFENRFHCKVRHHIDLIKKIPVSAGLGGGTSDCATTIHALCSLYGQRKPAPYELLELGADVPICFYGQPARMCGIGEILTPVAPLHNFGLLLVNPRFAVSTAAVFQSSKISFSSPSKAENPIDEIFEGHNDLEEAAISLCPEIDVIRLGLSQTSAKVIRMSGSGASVFALYENQEEAERALIQYQKLHPKHWAIASCLRPAG